MDAARCGLPWRCLLPTAFGSGCAVGYLATNCYLPPHAGGGTYFGVPPKKQNALSFAYYSSGTAATRDTVHTHLFGRANLLRKFAYVPRLHVGLCTDLLPPLAADLAPSPRELSAKQTEGAKMPVKQTEGALNSHGSILWLPPRGSWLRSRLREQSPHPRKNAAHRTGERRLLFIPVISRPEYRQPHCGGRMLCTGTRFRRRGQQEPRRAGVLRRCRRRWHSRSYTYRPRRRYTGGCRRE